MLTAKYNRSTQHIEGLTILTTSAQTDEQINASGVVAYYAENACGAITRAGLRMATGASHESAAEALKNAEASARAAGRKMCKTCRAAAFAMMLDEAYAEQAERERQVAPAAEGPVAGLVAEWQDARAELAELERAEHPDVMDRFGRVWTWWKGDLYRHCGNAAPKHMINGFGLPSQTSLDNPNYDPCVICLDGRDRHVTACRIEWHCSHATCARMHLAAAYEDAYAEQAERHAAAQAAADAEQVVDFRLEVEFPDAPLEVRHANGRRFPVELRLDLTGPALEVFVPRDEDDEAFTLDAEPDHFGVYDAEDCGRLYWTIPPLELARAHAFLTEIADEAVRVVAGCEWRSGYFELSPAAQDATDRIAARCAELAR